MRMVAAVRGDHPDETSALQAVAEKLDIGSRETRRNRVKQYEIDAGRRPATTTEASAHLEALKENAELKRANETLKAATSLFASARPATHTLVACRRTRERGADKIFVKRGCATLR
ncbi:hypothetical protein [Streptomyces sp. S.PB5]|uniref:hypothetical protein n=1 Tax=Streptomyces sp. S.PB5 TaxID=3020844 RepID=UPI0025B2278F|nr:hypothetical protein [Streptomyces sp. S.PB5]MDN3028932.1 hypothetical protein [Streptomyces sp. S.PB5]